MPPVFLSRRVGIRAPLVQVLVSGIGQKLDEVVVEGDAGEEFGSLTELILFPALGTYVVLDLLELLGEDLVKELLGYLGAVIEDALLVVDPLPHLGPRDLRCRRSLHETEDRNRSTTREPGRQIPDTYADVVTE